MCFGTICPHNCGEGSIPITVNGMQVSAAQLPKLARLAAGRGLEGVSTSQSHNGTGQAPTSSKLDMEHFRHTSGQAYASVDVPESVIDILTSLRNYLQDKCEPPVYVSDRRFMKAVQLLQVVAFGDGRDEVMVDVNVNAIPVFKCWIGRYDLQ